MVLLFPLQKGIPVRKRQSRNVKNKTETGKRRTVGFSFFVGE